MLEVFSDSVYVPPFYFVGCTVRYPDQYVCVKRHYQSGPWRAGNGRGCPAYVAEVVQAVYLDFKYLERVWLGFDYLYGGADKY